ncbi:MAG: DUF4126 domain-containing protein [Pirellulaceae bacterium]|nr:DUF4126 domain-containing protein [Pirellulaceae bacterium]
MELVLALCLGIGLSAGCGFRVFVPLLGMNVAALAGHLDLGPGFEWIGTWPAFACFLTATVLEIGAYYIPWLDNLLDAVATPAAIVAGTIATAAALGQVENVSPLVEWSLALIAGGGTAAVVQTSTVALRGASTATTGGLANFVVSTGELIASVGATILALVLPILCATLVLISAFLAMRWLTRRQPALATQKP